MQELIVRPYSSTLLAMYKSVHVVGSIQRHSCHGYIFQLPNG